MKQQNRIQKNKQKTSQMHKEKVIYKSVLKKITPNKNDIAEEKKLFEEIKSKIFSIKGKHSHLEWCGSSARGTHLKGDRDLDLFLMFDKELNEQELEKEGLRIGKAIFRGHNWEKAYSQHPYIRGIIKGFDVEIVPGYIVGKGSEKKSAVDRTPFHNKYLLEKMSAKQKQDARLLKQFLKGINAYGADLKNQALPGYGVELLILNYGSFEKTLKEISKWKIGEKIKFNNKKSKEFEEPLTIVDPVDENRNVASALSLEQFERMILASKKFLEKPNINFFFPKNAKQLNKKQVKNVLEKKELIGVKTDFPKNVLPDLVWGQLRRVLHKMRRHLQEKDFRVLRENIWSNEKEVWFIYELDTLTLQKARKIIGPKAIDKENVDRFLVGKKLLSGPRIEGERIVIEIERKKTKAKDILQEFIIETKRHEGNAMKKSLGRASVVTEKDLLREYKGEFAKFFSNYLKGKELFE